MDPHTSVGIAQTVFYANAVPICLYVTIRNWRKGERSTWYALSFFSLIRLASGILTIIRSTSKPSDVGVVIGALVLLNIGMIPLVNINQGFIRMTLDSSFPEKTMAKQISKVLHIATIVSIGLIIASSSLIGSTDAADAQQALIKTGYVLLMAILISIIVFLIILLRHQSSINREDAINMKLALLASPFVVIRGIYGLLYAFNSNNFYNNFWNPLWGSAVAVALMALLPEFIALVIYTYLGFRRFLTVRKQMAAPLASRDDTKL